MRGSIVWSIDEHVWGLGAQLTVTSDVARHEIPCSVVGRSLVLRLFYPAGLWGEGEVLRVMVGGTVDCRLAFVSCLRVQSRNDLHTVRDKLLCYFVSLELHDQSQKVISHEMRNFILSGIMTKVIQVALFPRRLKKQKKWVGAYFLHHLRMCILLRALPLVTPSLSIFLLFVSLYDWRGYYSHLAVCCSTQ